MVVFYYTKVIRQFGYCSENLLKRETASWTTLTYIMSSETICYRPVYNHWQPEVLWKSWGREEKGGGGVFQFRNCIYYAKHLKISQEYLNSYCLHMKWTSSYFPPSGWQLFTSYEGNNCIFYHHTIWHIRGCCSSNPADDMMTWIYIFFWMEMF